MGDSLIRKIINMTIFAGVFALLVSVWPNPEMPEGIVTGMTYLFDLLFEWDFLLPAVSMIRIVQIILGVEIALAIVQGYIFAYRLSGLKR